MPVYDYDHTTSTCTKCGAHVVKKTSQKTHNDYLTNDDGSLHVIRASEGYIHIKNKDEAAWVKEHGTMLNYPQQKFPTDKQNQSESGSMEKSETPVLDLPTVMHIFKEFEKDVYPECMNIAKVREPTDAKAQCILASMYFKMIWSYYKNCSLT